MPAEREALEALPGVGRKTANVVLNVAFGEPTIAVDTHIFRVANRTGLAPGKDARSGRAEARQIRPGRIQAVRASLADPARALRLHRARAEMPDLRHPRPLRVPAQDSAALPMFTPTRDEARRFLITAWSKFRADAPRTPLEQMAVDLIALHPEYHPLLEHPERDLDRDWRPESGETNPFLHLSLHLAVAEQLGIDQPPWNSRAIRAPAHRARRRARGTARGAGVPRRSAVGGTAPRHAAGCCALPRVPRATALTADPHRHAVKPAMKKGALGAILPVAIEARQYFAESTAGCAA